MLTLDDLVEFRLSVKIVFFLILVGNFNYLRASAHLYVSYYRVSTLRKKNRKKLAQSY